MKLCECRGACVATLRIRGERPSEHAPLAEDSTIEDAAALMLDTLERIAEEGIPGAVVLREAGRFVFAYAITSDGRLTRTADLLTWETVATLERSAAPAAARELEAPPATVNAPGGVA